MHQLFSVLSFFPPLSYSLNWRAKPLRTTFRVKSAETAVTPGAWLVPALSVDQLWLIFCSLRRVATLGALLGLHRSGVMLLEAIRPRSWGNQVLMRCPSKWARSFFSRTYFQTMVKLPTDRDLSSLSPFSRRFEHTILISLHTAVNF